MTSDRDGVLVVGAGPTGLLLAGQLARRGVPVRVVDKRAEATVESRALAVHARTLEVLDNLGLADEFVARGHRVRAFSMWDGRRRLARVDFGVLDTPFPFLLDLPQHETEAILRAYLGGFGARVEQSTEVVHVEQGADRVFIGITRDGDGGGPAGGFEVGYAVGCDGAHSTVRRRLGMPFNGHGYAEDWLLADVSLDWDRPDDEVHIVFNPTGRATVCMPLPGGRWRIILYFAGDRPTGQPPTPAEIATLVDERIPGPVAVHDPTWLACFRTHRRSAPAYRDGRVFLAGDAVNIHSPAGGQGMNTGLQDAHNLGWKLAAVCAGADPALLDSYQAERARVAHDVSGLTHRLVRLASLSAPWQRALRAAAVPLVAGLPGSGRRAAERISQLYVDYRGSPLISGALDKHRNGLRPGDRAPDVSDLRLRGRSVRLHHLLRSAHHTLVVLADEPGRSPGDAAATVRRLRRYAAHLRMVIVARTPAGATVAADPTGEAHRRYRGHGGVHLIRPDGYVAACGTEAAEAYLARLYPDPTFMDTRPDRSLIDFGRSSDDRQGG